jgi:hypothetical protein
MDVAILANPKSKLAAILLAVFLGCWTWLYTYKKDGWKFWLGLPLMIMGMAVMAFTTLIIITSAYTFDLPTDPVTAWLIAWLIAYSITLGLNIWAIIDRATKKSSWYEKYPN